MNALQKTTAAILVFLLCISVLIMWVPGAYINPTLFQAGLYLTAAVWALRMVFRPMKLAVSFPLLPLTLAALWGPLQLLTHTTVSRWETTQATLMWTANLAAFFLALQVCQSPDLRRKFLKALVIFAFLITIISILQFFSMPSKVLWIYFDGYGSSFGPFENRDRFGMFAELIIPLALWFALRQSTLNRALFYSVVAATLFAGVIAGASRAGSALCALEIIVFWIAGQNRRNLSGRVNPTTAKFAILASVFTIIVGFSTLIGRFHDPDPYLGRREMLISSIAMAKERPWLGFGLGNYLNAYPQHSVIDMNKTVVHAHNDWAEWAADGGIPFLAFMLSIAIWTVPKALRSLWAIGILSVFAHALVDFPLQTPVLEFWLFTFLGALAAASTT